jgi:hypothetical protein
VSHAVQAEPIEQLRRQVLRDALALHDLRRPRKACGLIFAPAGQVGKPAEVAKLLGKCREDRFEIGALEEALSRIIFRQPADGRCARETAALNGET